MKQLSEIKHRATREINDAAERLGHHESPNLQVIPSHVAEKWILAMFERAESRIQALEKEKAELKTHVERLVDVVDEVSTATNANMLPQEVLDLAADAIRSAPKQLQSSLMDNGSRLNREPKQCL